MRSAVLFAVPLVAAAAAQTTTTGPIVETLTIPSGTTSIKTTFTYSNGETSYLTETNSNGVVTGIPPAATSQAGLPPGVSTQPTVATIPAGEPSGLDTITQQGPTAVTTFIISVGSSTTDVLGPAPQTAVSSATKAGSTPSSAASSSGAAPAKSSSAGKGGKGGQTTAAPSSSLSPAGSSSASTAATSSKTSSGAAAGLVNAAPAGLLGLGGLLAALL